MTLWNITRLNWREICKTIKMALRKYDMADNEQFITPIRSLYSDHVISVDDFKDRNAGIMKNHWIDTSHGEKGEKIYELFDPDTDGEIVKELMQEWLCDNRHKVTQCIGIALWNHKMSYAEWLNMSTTSQDLMNWLCIACLENTVYTLVFTTKVTFGPLSRITSPGVMKKYLKIVVSILSILARQRTALFVTYVSHS